MLTKNEIASLSLSPTKKDFVQIWNELLEVAGKLSERWDPTSTNESDPGIVILKALAGIADKLNYNIDKNTLEAFMPTAAQEDSMRKLCDMLGYNVKYYRSAETTVNIKYYNSDPSEEEATALKGALELPKFTVITNSDQDISYFTTNETPLYISADTPQLTVTCMEGQIVKCESANDNNVITPNQIYENNRFYLPETQVAENGIFVYNVSDSKVLGGTGLADGAKWEKVDNLNVQARGTRVYKFGFDSYKSRPYLEFPEDYSSLFNDGIFIYYTRTNGASGNVSARTLTKIELPTTGNWSSVSAESFSVENVFSATNGANVETIKQSYNNFKKTIGTFETLVTCRDYMNKIYTMVDDEGRFYASNNLVTDIRNDLNRAVTICSCDDAGIFYKEMAITEEVAASTSAMKPVFTASGEWRLGSETGMKLTNKGSFITSDYTNFDLNQPGEVNADTNGCWAITQNSKKFTTNLPCTSTSVKPLIDHFDLVLYPFKSYNQIKNNVKDIRKVYDASFNYSQEAFVRIDKKLDESSIKTVAHKIVPPRPTIYSDDNTIMAIGDIVSINNYLRLNATITTNSKITVEEGSIIIDKIKIALANAFNMHELDFGEEIPFDSIVEVIETADSRIRVAALNEPTLYTTFSVLDKYDNGIAKTKEYAVASDWLTIETAKTVPQIDVVSTTTSGDTTLGTFDTVEARKIYNKLAVRNILAGRVPLFNYNNTFKTSFSEGAYLGTKSAVGEIPHELQQIEVNKSNPFAIYTHEGKTYTKCYINEDLVEYKETYVPENCADFITTVQDNAITEIATSCEIFPDTGSEGEISDVKLAAGEYIKFRAPNFTTIKTYPAYVNYHLALNKELLSSPVPADATSLFELLDVDRSAWSTKNTDIRWQKVLDYFSDSPLKKTFSLSQKISKYSQAASSGEDLCSSPENTSGQHVRDTSTGKCKYCGVTMFDPIQKGPIVITVNNSPTNVAPSAEELLASSGCVKLVNPLADTGFKAILKWDTSDGDPVPSGEGPDLPIELDIGNPFITDAAVLAGIKEAINTRLEELKGQVNEDGTPCLPTECAWTISFDFECVPFNAESLSAWETFIKYKTDLFDFSPIGENGTIFWRIYGEGYSVGKYVLQSTEKLLKFDSNYFDVLPSIKLTGIYLVSDLGKDAVPAVIKNDEEHMLQTGEYLYIEYTPSTTTEDGTVQEQEAITEVLGPGTIIRPSGFEEGLIDSTIYEHRGNSSHKTVTFEINGTPVQIKMQRFGANEQVEVRDFAKVELTKDSFKTSNSIYYYKNFNNCPELEKLDMVNGVRVNNKYTLKDGEYIFYTDSNKAELAYFTTGTQVTLGGRLTMDQFDVIELSTIFDSGLSAIPWKFKSFSDNDAIVFEEFQYRTIGPNDTLKHLTLIDNKMCLNDTWQYCNNVEYLVAGSEEVQKLPSINVYADDLDRNKGNGWEASSILVLDVANNSAQTLRNTEQVKTSITLTSTSVGGAGGDSLPPITSLDEAHPLSFKTNLRCQTASSKVNIKDIYPNPNKLEGFELKIFATDAPVTVKTEPDKVVPYHGDNITDITNWPGTPLAIKNYSELWNTVNLDDIKTRDPADDETDYDNALRLPISVLPNTYGVFSIYVNYTSNATAKTWIEVLPGTSHNDITILNVPETDITWEAAVDVSSNSADKLLLRPGINCIRVNKTGRIFIKASKNAQGTICFDELKLVHCQQIECKDPTGNSTEPITLTTQGLNIKQLGYLDSNDYTELSEIIDKDMRKKFKTGYIDRAFTGTKECKGINDLSKEAEKDFSSRYSELLELKPKIQKLVDFIEDAKKEIAKLLNVDLEAENIEVKISEDDKEKLFQLFQQYTSCYAELNRETALLEALNNNDIDSTTQQLVSILGDLDSTYQFYEQQILNELETLKAKAIANADKFSKEDILYDFRYMSDNDRITPKAKQDLEYSCVKEINMQYNEQLAGIASSLEKVTDSDARAKLLSALEGLNEIVNAEQRASILYNIRRLTEQVNQTQVFSYLDTAYKSALVPNYGEVVSALSSLREYLSLGVSTVKFLASELEQSVSNGSDEHLKDIATKLSILAGNLADGDDSTDDDGWNTEYSCTCIDGILEAIMPKLSEENPVVDETNVIGPIEELRSSLTTDYFNTLADIAFSIEVLAGAEADSGTGYNPIDDTYIKIIESLKKTTQSSQAKEILARLDPDNADSIMHARQSTVDAMSQALDNGIIALLDIPAGKEAVLSVWPKYMKEALITGVEFIYNECKDYITIHLGQTANVFIMPESLENRSALVSAANTLAFENLYERANYLDNTGYLQSSYRDLIKNINKQMPISVELTTAMTDLKDNSSLKIYAMREIIVKLQNTAVEVADKQRLLKELRSELDSAIKTNKQLVNVCANLLCPNILLLEEKLPEVLSDEFYENLSDMQKFMVDKLVKSTTAAELIQSLLSGLDSYTDFNQVHTRLLRTLHRDNSDEFRTWMLSSAPSWDDSSLLSGDCQNNLTEITKTIIKQSEIAAIRGRIAEFYEESGESIDSWVQANLMERDLLEILDTMVGSIKKLEVITEVEEESKKAHNTLLIEELLLTDIRAIDRNRDFYYTVPADASLAIEFNESDDKLNTLANPAANYDINNINNNFVISKLDIDYLDKGLQIARSSRLN